MVLCERCGEKIAVANDLDLAGVVNRRRHLIMVAGSRRSLTATHWQIFMLLYRHRGDVVYNDSIHAELSEGRDRPSAKSIRNTCGSYARPSPDRGIKSSIIEASAMN